MQFDLTDLRLFVAIADARSITHGAAKANLALASASARIKNLERTVGTALLVRSRRGVTMTAAGETLRAHARIVLNDLARMRGDLLAHARGLRATIHLLTNTAGMSEHLPRPLSRFLSAHPAISVDVEERESADIVAAINAGAADIGIAIEKGIPPTVTHYPFRRDRLVVVVPERDRLAKRRALEFSDLVLRDFVGLDEASALQSHLAAQAAYLGARINYRARLKSLNAVCQMVAEGVGIAVVPDVTARRCAKTLGIRTVALKDSWAFRSLVICVREPSRLSVPVRDLVAHLRGEAGQ